MANDPQAWIYWAAKEAAWKVWFRRSAQRLLNPKAFVVQNLKWQAQQINFELVGPDENYIGSAELNDEYLHAVVVRNSGTKGSWKSYKASVCAKAQLSAQLNADHQLKTYAFAQLARQKKSQIDYPLSSKPTISLFRNNLGIPSLEIAGNVLDLPISMSHHGSWAAFAYVYP